MTYNADLSERTRKELDGNSAIYEKRMFGGLSFLLQGNMVCGVLGDELIVRVGPEKTDEMLAEPGTRPFDFTGRPMTGWVVVSFDVLRSDEELAVWIDRGLSYASTLPPKTT